MKPAEPPIRFAVTQCSLGWLLVANSERGLCAVSLGDDVDALVDELKRRVGDATRVVGDHEFDSLVAQVVGLIEAPHEEREIALDLEGTPFQKRVWAALQAIEPGRTVTYAELAEAIDAPQSVRAVAGACAANKHAVVIPCHRVIRADGGLSGYRWGVARKRALLDREAGTLPMF